MFADLIISSHQVNWVPDERSDLAFNFLHAS